MLEALNAWLDTLTPKQNIRLSFAVLGFLIIGKIWILAWFFREKPYKVNTLPKMTTRVVKGYPTEGYK